MKHCKIDHIVITRRSRNFRIARAMFHCLLMCKGRNLVRSVKVFRVLNVYYEFGVNLFSDCLASLIPSSAAVEPKTKSWGRKVVSGGLICLTGGVALSALDDLVIFGGCSTKAMEKASKSQAIIDAIGEPIVRGPWYNASLAVAQKRNSVSCSFPVSGPHGTGMVQLKAVRNGDNSRFSYFRKSDWDILIMDALLHIPSDEDEQKTIRISVSDNIPPPNCEECTYSKSPNLAVPKEAKS